MVKLAETPPTTHPPDHLRAATDAVTGGNKAPGLAHRLRAHLKQLFLEFPWKIIFHDWTGASYEVGVGELHWYGKPLVVTIKTPAAARMFLSYNGLGILEKFVQGEVDMNDNLFVLSDIKKHGRFELSLFQKLLHRFRHKMFQNISRATVNVKSHYDLPQEVFNIYLDKTYLSYSSAIFENPFEIKREELIREGVGKTDTFDSLEKAQWRKFKDAVDFVKPAEGETLLDVGCGYSGQLQVALENYPFKKVVGWTLSRNQVELGRQSLAGFDPDSWELNEGDYRQDDRVFDHITSTGMISHVGPRGLVPYVRNVHDRIKSGGRYVHHSLMTNYSKGRFDFEAGVAFNKKYVWPGFHWFTIGEHVKALEENGFRIEKLVNLSPHYTKTIAAWYERMMNNETLMREFMDERTFRAWQIYLAGASGSLGNGNMFVYRIYCVAI